MFGTPSSSHKKKKARYKRFQYAPREYDTVKEDIAERRERVRDKLNGEVFEPDFRVNKKPRKSFFKPAHITLLGVLFFLWEIWMDYLGRGHFGDYSTSISIGGIVTFAYFFIRFNKRH